MKYIIIHGHFYQPPRENPSINIITEQASALPSHDWNERIVDECYAPNAYSRLLDNYGRITSLVNNYEYLSYNFGPTLLDYIAETRPDVLERIVDGDRKSVLRLGHGNAIAQSYNHIIMPLASKEDMYVQVEWAIYNFQKYFNHFPEGMWLSETAINGDTISVLSKAGIKFVVLSPFQANFVKNEHGEIMDVSNARINTSIPYKIYSEDGSSITAFFYDAQISQSIAFEHVLRNVDVFSNRIRAAHDSGLRMLNLATDGESYGHHEPFGDMCLSRYFTNVVDSGDVTITNYAHYLSINDVKNEAILHAGYDGKGTSWSCAHGVERWRSDCGCSTGGMDGWNQKWRKPLREAFDVLRKLQDTIFAKELGFTEETRIVLRSSYIKYIYDNDKIDEIYDTCSSKISKENFILLMEAYKYSVFAFTSCGWFFADISGIEPMQNMKYANRSFILLRKLRNHIPHIDEAYNKFCKKLELAISNCDNQTGIDLFRLVEQEEYSECYIINHGIIDIIAQKKAVNVNDINNVYGYEIIVTDVDKNIIIGAITHKYIPKKYFKVKNIITENYIENYIKLSYEIENIDKSIEKKLSMKDIISEDKNNISSMYLSEKIESVNDNIYKLMSVLDDLIDVYAKNEINCDYDFDRILGSLYSPILRGYIEKEGQIAYAKVSDMLLSLRSTRISVSTSGIARLIENTIFNKLNKLQDGYSKDLVRDILEDVKFVTTNEMPVKRYQLENMFYIIANDMYKNNISFKDDKDFKTLGTWLNFSVDKIKF